MRKRSNITRVVNVHREGCDVMIGRPSKWGNPFSHMPGSMATFFVGSRKEAIERYEEWIRQQPDLMSSLGELEGKRLGCFCSPKPCHGDVLVKLIREKRHEERSQG